MCVDEIGAELVDLVEGQRRRCVGVDHRGVPDVIRSCLEHRPHRQLDDVDVRPVQRCELGRVVGDRCGSDAGVVHEARNLDARAFGQRRDQARVGDVAVDDARLTGDHRVHDRRGVLVRPLDRHRAATRERRFHPLERLEVLLAAADVLADRDAVAVELAIVPHEPGHVLGGVLARLGREVAETLVEGDPDASPELGVGGDPLVEPRIQVLALALEAEEECLVVDPRREKGDLVLGHVDQPAQLLDRELDRVTEPDDVGRRRALVDELAERRHRVRVVEKPGAGRTEVGHLPSQREHVLRCAEGAEDPADAERVADRLTKPVPRRELEVAERRLVSPDLDHVEDEVGAVERCAPIEVRADPWARPALAGHVMRHRLGGVEPVGVDVVERDLDLAQRREREDVPEQVLREDNTARADERDPRHPLCAPRVSPLTNCFWSRTNTTSVGIAVSSAPAASRLLSVKN